MGRSCFDYNTEAAGALQGLLQEEQKHRGYLWVKVLGAEVVRSKLYEQDEVVIRTEKRSFFKFFCNEVGVRSLGLSLPCQA